MENLAMKELERGREYVKQLQQLMILKYDNGEDREALMTSYAQDLAAKVEDSLRNAILLLSYQLSGVSADSPPNSDESHGRCESRSHTIKDPTRFSPQKRKCIQTWEDCSKIGPKEDGYAWRKYGEKFILNAKHPRCYFRCTYKYEKGCEATKQVQIIQDSPPLYKTTYFGYHTCSKPHIFLDPHHLSSSSTGLISFDATNNNKTTLDQNNNCKQESINDYAPSSSTSNDCLLSPTGEVLLFQYDELMDMISSSKIGRSVRIASN